MWRVFTCHRLAAGSSEGLAVGHPIRDFSVWSLHSGLVGLPHNMAAGFPEQAFQESKPEVQGILMIWAWKSCRIIFTVLSQLM